MSAMVERREFITLLSGSVACPLVARAQQPKMAGFLYTPHILA